MSLSSGATPSREGETKGRIETRAGDVLTVFRVRGIAVPGAAHVSAS
jgi:hypothetical protein